VELKTRNKCRDTKLLKTKANLLNNQSNQTTLVSLCFVSAFSLKMTDNKNMRAKLNKILAKHQNSEDLISFIRNVSLGKV
jgi:hypothetical protein